MPAMHILTLNTGSSSLKSALYRVEAPGAPERPEWTAQVERIGQPGARLRLGGGLGGATGAAGRDEPADLPDHDAALRALFDWLRRERPGMTPDAVGHRVVHGGARYGEPARITAEVVAALRELVPIDPDHMPQALAAIAAAGRAYPDAPQVACFDTAFHRRMPRVAQLYALPRELLDAGVVRYGFHGLSYESIAERLRGEDAAAADGRVVVAHLGNGASMAALRGGVSVDTTMGFTPLGGLVMGTRPGDLDPGVLVYLVQGRGMDAAGLGDLLNRRAGLLGLSGTSADMRDLLGREAEDPRAADAVGLFCYQARKFLGALAAALCGLDTLVFTGGIGEHAAPVRARICAGLEFLGIQLDADRNAAHAPIISRAGGAVTVRVLATDEDRMIARHTYRLVGIGPTGGGGPASNRP